MKTLFQHINESKPEKKDFDRINGIVKKASGNSDKIEQLSGNMAKAIKDKEKAEARFLAAQDILGNTDPATQVFLRRAIELGCKNLDKFIENTAIAHQAEEVEDTEKLASHSDRMSAFGEKVSKGLTVVSLGKVNIKTGKADKISISAYKNGVVYFLKNSNKEERLVFDANAKQSKFKLGSTIGLIDKISGAKHASGKLSELVDWCMVDDLPQLAKEHGLIETDSFVIK